MIEELKLLANKKDVPYQSLMKLFLSERITRGTFNGFGAFFQALTGDKAFRLREAKYAKPS